MYLAIIVVIHKLLFENDRQRVGLCAGRENSTPSAPLAQNPTLAAVVV
jgi:hypothetical protein